MPLLEATAAEAAESSSSVIAATAETPSSVTAAAESSSSVTAAATEKVGNGVPPDSDSQQALDSVAEGDKTQKEGEGEEKGEGEKGESLKDVNNDLEMSSDDDEDSREGFDPHDTCGDGADRQVTVLLNFFYL